MKTNFLPSLAAVFAVASMMTTASTALAQDANATAPTVVATPAETQVVQPAPAPQLAYGVSQILQLSQAKVDDGTIISYIKNSGNSYGLNADQIIYLRQQGISTGVINAMLSQPPPGVMTAGSQQVPMPSTPAPQVSYPQQPAPAQNSGMVGPSVSGIDPTAAAAANYYYYQPYYYPYYSYPYYPSYGYPGVSVSLGWGGRWGPGWGGWHGGGGWGGGWHGGGWGGGGFHGGWHH